MFDVEIQSSVVGRDVKGEGDEAGHSGYELGKELELGFYGVPLKIGLVRGMAVSKVDSQGQDLYIAAEGKVVMNLWMESWSITTCFQRAERATRCHDLQTVSKGKIALWPPLASSRNFQNIDLRISGGVLAAAISSSSERMI